MGRTICTKVNRISDENLIKCLLKHNGLQTLVGDELGYSQAWVSQRVKRSTKVQEAIKHLYERRVDRAEAAVDRLLCENNPSVAMFILKTLGKNRGYVEEESKKIDVDGLEALGKLFSSIKKED